MLWNWEPGPKLRTKESGPHIPQAAANLLRPGAPQGQPGDPAGPLTTAPIIYLFPLPSLYLEMGEGYSQSVGGTLLA